MQTARAPAGKNVYGLRADWKHPTEILFGAGRAAELPDACERLGIKHPLLVTDPALARRGDAGRMSASRI